MRILPLLVLLASVSACSRAELVRYTVDVQILEVPDWLTPAEVNTHYQVAPCTNAEIFDETIRVYQGYDPDAVTAIKFNWTGFDLSNGGENTETVFLGKGETYTVVAALDPSIELYEIDDRGRMLQIERDVAKVSKKKTAETEYELGEGLPIGELHELAKGSDEVDFIEEGAFNCDITQF